MSHTFVQKLPEVALDIVGDIHGELDALNQLLENLGYDQKGSHPQKRHLVFVGDFCDRGHDSPGVLRKIKLLIENKNASAIIGNHELNLLLNDPKDGSGWYFDERQFKDNAFYSPYKKAKQSEKKELYEFIKKLPLALERSDIRIVHACWNKDAINKIKKSNHQNVVTAYKTWEQETLNIAVQTGLDKSYQNTLMEWKETLENPNIKPPFLRAIADYEILERQHNPIKVITSGLENYATAPFFIGNKWRFTDRVRWWDEYDEAIPVVMGHYWRSLVQRSNLSRYSQLFDGTENHEWLGLRKNVYCIDFSIGANWRVRHPTISASPEYFHLGALRWPENELMLNSGQRIPLSAFKNS